MFDKQIRLFDEGYTPAQLDEFSSNKKLYKWSLLRPRFYESHYLQMKILYDLGVSSVLEFGAGEAFARDYFQKNGVKYHTYDFDNTFSPDFLGDLKSDDFKSIPEVYEAVCAYQCLEHVDYAYFRNIIEKLMSLSSKYVVLSLPYSCFSIELSVSKLFNQVDYTKKRIRLVLPSFRANRKYRREYMEQYPYAVHYWEIGRKSFPLSRIRNDIQSVGLYIQKEFHAPYPYHYFFVLSK